MEVEVAFVVRLGPTYVSMYVCVYLYDCRVHIIVINNTIAVNYSSVHFSRKAIFSGLLAVRAGTCYAFFWSKTC